MPDPNIADLIREAERLASEADRLSAEFARDLERVLRNLENRIRAHLTTAAASESPAALLEKTRMLAQSRQEIRALLRSSGYDALAETASQRGLTKVAEIVLGMQAPSLQPAIFRPGILARIDALQALLGVDLLDEGDRIAASLWRAVLREVVADTPHEQALQNLSETLNKSTDSLRTLFDTSVSIYTRQVEAVLSTGEPEEAYMYAGPVDARLRPFCYEHVGKVYTRREIDGMGNGQLPNVFLTGGGYNCRHTFVAVSRFSEARELVGSDERVPEIAKALTRVKVERKAA